MDTVQVERRAAPGTTATESGSGNLAELVRQAMRLQACIGTPSAVEYLKAYDLGSQVISRVLSGGAVRAEDQGSRIDSYPPTS